jgi:protein O-GlcNAc transferase
MHHQVSQILEVAVQNFQSGNYDEVEIILLAFLKVQPKNFDALHILGVTKGIKNQHRDALALFDKANRINPNNSFLNYNIAKAFIAIGEDYKALKYHLNAIKLNPTYKEGWLGYGLSLSNLVRFNDALTSFNKAIELDPDYAEAWINRGDALAELGFYVDAISSYDKALQINPQLIIAWSNGGNVLQELKQFEQALASYDKAIAIKPDFADAWTNRGNALQELKQFKQALASYDKAIEFKPDFADAWANRGNVLFDINQFEQGEASLREAIRINPNFLIAHNNLLLNLNYCDTLNPINTLEDAKYFGTIVTQKSTPKFT